MDSEHEAGRELDALIAEKVMGLTRAEVYGRAGINITEMLPLYSEDIMDAWLVVDKMHAGINPAEMGPYQFLTLVCTGTYTGWAASFDFNLSHDWYEADMIVSCPFAARGATPALAICRAALKVISGA